MAGGEAILAALQGMNQKPQDTTLGAGASAIAGIAPSLYNPYGSTASNIGGVVGAGLLSALLAGWAKNDADAHNAALIPIRNQFLSGTPEQQVSLAQQNPELSPLMAAIQANQLTSTLDANSAGMIEGAKYKATAPFKQQEDILKATNDLLKDQGKLLVGDKIVSITDPAAEAAARAGAIKSAEMKAEIDSYPNGVKPADRVAMVKQYDADIANDPVTTQYIEVGTQVQALKEALAANDPVRAKAALYLTAKAIDPSVVKGEELKFWKATGGLGAQAEQYLADLEKGILRPGMVTGLNSLADSLIKSRYDSYKKMADTRLATLGSLIKEDPSKIGISLLPAPTIATQTAVPPQLKASDLIAQGYKKTPQGWVR